MNEALWNELRVLGRTRRAIDKRMNAILDQIHANRLAELKQEAERYEFCDKLAA